MDETYGHGKEAVPLTARKEIDDLLAALAPEQLVAPQRAPEADAHFLCMATDELRRLFTLQNILGGKCKELAVNNMKMAREAQQRLLSAEGVQGIIEEMRTPGSPALEALATMRRAHGEMERASLLFRAVSTLCRLEVARQHPDVQEKNVYLYNDWSLCWKEDTNDGRGVITRVTIRGTQSGPDEVPPHNLLH